MPNTLERRTSLQVIENILLEIINNPGLYDYELNQIRSSLAILETNPDLLTQVSILIVTDYICTQQNITISKTSNYQDLILHIKRGEHRLVDWSRY